MKIYDIAGKINIAKNQLKRQVDPEGNTKVYEAVQHWERDGATRWVIFEQVWILANEACKHLVPTLPPVRTDSSPVPSMSEPWYCCAEPTDAQLAGL